MLTEEDKQLDLTPHPIVRWRVLRAAFLSMNCSPIKACRESYIYNGVRKSLTSCHYCNDSGVNYKTDRSIIRCNRCFTSYYPRVYIDSRTMEICLK